jgi:hypothetical protein
VIEVWVLERLVPFDRSFWKPSGAALVAIVCGIALKAAMPVGTDFAYAGVQGAIVCCIYFAFLFLFGLPADDRLVIERMLGRIRSLSHRRRAMAHAVAEKT